MAEDTVEVFRDSLRTILEEYPTPDNIGSGTDFETAHGDHPMYKLVVNQAGGALTELIDTTTYTIKASVGRGSPTYIPYLAIMHHNETNSPQEGRYIVYLFDPVERILYLTLNQGATEAQQVASESSQTPEDLLRTRAQEIGDDINVPGFTFGEIGFSPPGKKSRLYGAGSVCYKSYELENFPDANTIYDDLQNLLQVYNELVLNDPPEVTDSYEGLTQAMDDIYGRLEQSGTTNWLADELTKSVVEDWSDVLTAFNRGTR